MIVIQAIDLCDMLKNAINNINDEQYTKKEDINKAKYNAAKNTYKEANIMIKHFTINCDNNYNYEVINQLMNTLNHKLKQIEKENNYDY